MSTRHDVAGRVEAVAWALVLAGLAIGGVAVLVTLRAAGWGQCR